MTQDTRSTKLRFALMAGGALVACGVVAAGVLAADSARLRYSDADRAASTAAVAQMDAAQARANQTREAAQKTSYKGF
ncbi:hypothetical protein GGQ87_001126 [Brevundimonas alba]|uniref:Uncharacterized protein n=1 Tax=Brevundimonas alba TaxID=74314 RepID=A0A7X6BMA5_9CAUL|nr:hypothetical protein [Brevundimonas alba]NJC40868.1 hypothetical protein [Brevundimonas alba]